MCGTKKWITSEELINVTVVAESTPGPIAINCATYVGYKLKGWWGAIISTLGMILPASLLIYFISLFFEDLLTNEIVRNAFKGINIAVCILIGQAAYKIITKTIKKSKKKSLPLSFITASFLIVFICNLLSIHFSSIYLIIIFGILGYFVYKNNKGGKK